MQYSAVTAALETKTDDGYPRPREWILYDSAAPTQVSRNNVDHEILRRKFRIRHPNKPYSHTF